jgi:hypothetical protein
MLIYQLLKQKNLFCLISIFLLLLMGSPAAMSAEPPTKFELEDFSKLGKDAHEKDNCVDAMNYLSKYLLASPNQGDREYDSGKVLAWCHQNMTQNSIFDNFPKRIKDAKGNSGDKKVIGYIVVPGTKGVAAAIIGDPGAEGIWGKIAIPDANNLVRPPRQELQVE